MRVFVTGATGFIGQKAVECLMRSGHECVCLVRSTSRREILESTACQFVVGDITDKGSLFNGMDGCEALVNLANVYSYWEPDTSIYEKVNAFFLTALANITKKPPAWGLSLDSIRSLAMQLRADGAKAERELGIDYTPIRKAIEECVESYRSRPDN